MSYSLNSSIVNKQEADALKEMIFKRARERAAAMNEDVQEDVMELARDSFVSKDNPFSQIVDKAGNANPATASAQPSQEKEEEIGFPPRRLNLQVSAQNKTLKENMASYAIHNTMEEARIGLAQKGTFIGALDFLNSQAAVSLMRTRTDKFEAIG